MDSLRNKMSSLTPFVRKHKVCVVGSGNWGSTIAKVVAENTASHPDLFEKEVQMWVYEETTRLDKKSKHYDSSSEWSTQAQKLTQLINHFHENVKYLPDIPLPANVVANPSVTEAVKDCTILVFNLPHQFIEGICKQLRGHILPYARGISCIKGVNVKESSISLFSETIGRELDIYCGALSGANIANEVAQEKFSETTVAYDPPQMDSQNPTPAHSAGPSPSSSHVDLTAIPHKDSSGKRSSVKLKPLPPEYQPIDHHTLKSLFHRRYFQVRVVSDVAAVSLGGALKNIVAVAAGWVDGLGWGDNAKAAIMRIGLLEMVEFGKRFFPKTVHTATFTEESAGVADLITTCNGGRNYRCARMSIKEGKPIEEIEARELNGQKLQGTLTAVEVNHFLKSQNLEKEFPLFTAVYNILQGEAKAQDLPELIEAHSDTEYHMHSDASKREDSSTIGSLSNEPGTFTAPPKTQNVPADDVSTLDMSTSVTPYPMLVAAPELASSRYNRQILVPQISLGGQIYLSDTRVLIVGVGGLGCPAAMYLAGAGVHTLGLVDGDTVELSNLHRQVLHSEHTVGWTKVDSAIAGLKRLNSQIRYAGHRTRLSTGQIALDTLAGYDIVLDCTDNPATRYLISDACVVLGIPLVSGAAQRVEGQLMVLNYPAGEGPCYRCLFPRPPVPETVAGCAEIGILGPVVGVVGVLMAAEVLRIVANKTQVLHPRPGMLLYNGWAGDVKGMFRGVGMRSKRKGCVACGEESEVKPTDRITVEQLKANAMDYTAFCGVPEDVKLLGPEERVSAKGWLDFMRDITVDNGKAPSIATGRMRDVVVDVREPHEVELGPKITGSINIPISRILRHSSGHEEELWQDLFAEHANNTGETPNFLFVCQRGNDSQIAARRFADHAALLSPRPGWVGDLEGGFLAIGREVALSRATPSSL